MKRFLLSCVIGAMFLIGFVSCGYSENDVKQMKFECKEERDKALAETKAQTINEETKRCEKITVEAVKKALADEVARRDAAYKQDREDPCGGVDASVRCMDPKCTSLETDKTLTVEANLRRNLDTVQGDDFCIDELTKRVKCLKGEPLVVNHRGKVEKEFKNEAVVQQLSCLFDRYYRAYQRAVFYAMPLSMRAFSEGQKYIAPRLDVVVGHWGVLQKKEIDPKAVGTSIPMLTLAYQRAFAEAKSAWSKMPDGDDKITLHSIMCNYVTSIEYQYLPQPAANMSNAKMAASLKCETE